MSNRVELDASDGHALGAYRADPQGAARGGIVLIQEVFGVNEHIRGVCDGYAAEGYAVLAPALFDRVACAVELSYDAEGLARGRALRGELGWDAPVLDIQAACEALADFGKVAVIGYCWGASLAWLAATRLELAAAIGYYGGQIKDFITEQPRCPVLLHFGKHDAFVPNEDWRAVRERHPEVVLHTYPAGHGFNCEVRSDFHAQSGHARAHTQPRISCRARRLVDVRA